MGTVQKEEKKNRTLSPAGMTQLCLGDLQHVLSHQYRSKCLGAAFPLALQQGPPLVKRMCVDG